MERLLKTSENCERLITSEEQVQQWIEEMMTEHSEKGDRDLGNWYWTEAWDSCYRWDFYDRFRTRSGWWLNRLRLEPR